MCLFLDLPLFLKPGLVFDFLNMVVGFFFFFYGIIVAEIWLMLFFFSWFCCGEIDLIP